MDSLIPRRLEGRGIFELVKTRERLEQEAKLAREIIRICQERIERIDSIIEGRENEKQYTTKSPSEDNEDHAVVVFNINAANILRT